VMTKPLIGIPASEINGVVGVKTDLVKFASLFGNVTLLTEYRAVDAILLPGGSDIDTLRYGQSRGWWTYPPNPMLEYFDAQVLPAYMGTIPIIGICRGLQLINVQCGGTLWQHDFFIKYSQHDNDLVDYIKTDSGNFRANSFHHQHIQRLGAGLKVLARDRFLRIEAIENPKSCSLSNGIQKE
jgi:putative glutamine amidotransferase